MSARPLFTADELRTAIDLAAYPATLRDQQGRYWGKWLAGAPQCHAVCSKCGCSIESGYCLLPEAQIKICQRHVKRWV